MNINECILHNLRKLRKNRFMYKIIVHCNVLILFLYLHVY